MAVGHGLQGNLKVGSNNVGQLRNIKSGTKAQLDSKAVMGDTWDSFLVGLKTGQGSADCLFDPADTTGQETLTEGAAVTLHVQPQGSAPGKRNLAVSAIVESIDLDINIGGAVQRSFSWRINAAPAWTTLL